MVIELSKADTYEENMKKFEEYKKENEQKEQSAKKEAAEGADKPAEETAA